MQTLGLRQAVAASLRASRGEALRDPHRFIGYVTDLIDTETPVARVLYLCCDERFLGLFAEAYGQRNADALYGVSFRAADYLRDEFVIDPNVAMPVSWSIAAGCADALGIALPMSLHQQQIAQAGWQAPPIASPTMPPVGPTGVGQAAARAQTSAPAAAHSTHASASSATMAAVVANRQASALASRHTQTSQSSPSPSSVSSATMAAVVANRQASALASRHTQTSQSSQSSPSPASASSATMAAVVANRQASALASRPSRAGGSVGRTGQAGTSPANPSAASGASSATKAILEATKRASAIRDSSN